MQQEKEVMQQSLHAAGAGTVVLSFLVVQQQSVLYSQHDLNLFPSIVGGFPVFYISRLATHSGLWVAYFF